jgi:hypothetical protein
LSVPIFARTKLSVEKCPTTLVEIEDVYFVHYVNADGILMYVMVCTILYIAQVVGVLS